MTKKIKRYKITSTQNIVFLVTNRETMTDQKTGGFEESTARNEFLCAVDALKPLFAFLVKETKLCR